MDCGDGVTVNIFKRRDGTDNGSSTTGAERSVSPLEIEVVPHDGISSKGNTCSTVQVQMLHPRSLEILAALQDGTPSSDSSNNSHTDICTLEVDESHYAMETKYENKDANSSNLDNSGSSIDAPDFTVIHAPGKIRTKKEKSSTINKLLEPQEMPSTSTQQAKPKLTDELPKLFDRLSHTTERTIKPMNPFERLDDKFLPFLEPLPLPEDPPDINYLLLQSIQPEQRKFSNKSQQPQSFQKLQPRGSTSGAFAESTEVLCGHSSEYNIGKSLSYGHALSSTDSDVEVLMSEEIVESDWSAGATAADGNARTPDDGDSHTNKNSKPTKKLNSALKKKGDSTDQELSVEEFSQRSSSISTSDELSATRLKDIIREQLVRIKELQSKIEYYERAQNALFGYIDSWRVALEKKH